MKGTEKIIAHIQADAQAQVDAILDQARQQCKAIQNEYSKKAGELYAEKIRVGVKAVQDLADSQGRIAQMEAKKSVLALKQEMVSKSFDQAAEKLLKLPEADYVAFLAKLAAKASVTGDEELIFNARDRKAVGAKVVEAANAKLGGGKLTLSDETRDFAGGVILRRGNVEANCTVELLVELCRGEMSSQLAAVLFEQ